MGVKVAKFGGSSLSDAIQLEKTRRIINQDEDRRYIVVSAPGKRCDGDRKVTDCLYLCKKLAVRGLCWRNVYNSVRDRFLSTEINLALERGRRKEGNACVHESRGLYQKRWESDLLRQAELIERLLEMGGDEDFAASRGEYLNGMLVAKYIGYDFVDSRDLIYFDERGNLLIEESLEAIRIVMNKHRRAVIPGFYGAKPSGEIKTFSRGGSDITGALVAAAVGADVYENWTDVSGFLMADPQIVENPKRIRRIDYCELRELSRMGARVLHEEAIYPARLYGIPINIRNTNEPADEGTLIFDSEYGSEDASEDIVEVSGIAGSKGFAEVSVDLPGEADVSDALKVFERISKKNALKLERAAYSSDMITAVFKWKAGDEALEDLTHELRTEVGGAEVRACANIGIIAVVGRGIEKAFRVTERIFKSLADFEIEVLFAEKKMNSRSLILGVWEEQLEKVIKIIYNNLL